MSSIKINLKELENTSLYDMTLLGEILDLQKNII